jgi:hypothetical protein
MDERPELEKMAALAPAARKLGKAIDDFLARAELAIHKNSAEFAELFALLSRPEHRSTITLAWLNRHAAAVVGKKKYTKLGKREKEDFAVTLVRAGAARPLIQELKDSPKRKMQELLHSLAGLSEAKAAEKIRALKTKQLEEFCLVNDIPTIRRGTGSLDRKQTLPNIMRKVESLKEYLKL